MALNRSATQFRRRDDALGDITPKVILNAEVRAPKGPRDGWHVAPYLPILFSRRTDAGGDDHFVIGSGKVVALDAQSHVVPAGLKIQLKAGATALTYTQLDADMLVEDLVTGATVAGPVVYSTAQVGQALVERGLVLASEVVAAGGTVPVVSNAHGEFAVDVFIHRPIGFAQYDMFVPSKFTNYNKQPIVAFQTEAQLQIGQLSVSAGTDAFVVATLDGSGTTTAAVGEQVASGEYWDAANLAALTRYAEMGVTAATPVVGLGVAPGVGQRALAANTKRTPFTVDVAGVLVSEKSSPTAIKKEGDWYLDAELGTLFLHTDTWATGVGATATWTFSFYFYAASPATSQRFALFNGRALPARRVTYDAQSNYVMAVEGTTPERDIVGSVLYVDAGPDWMLKSVKTGFPGTLEATGALPGSSSGGYSDKITKPGERIADQLVTILFSVR